MYSAMYARIVVHCSQHCNARYVLVVSVCVCDTHGRAVVVSGCVRGLSHGPYAACAAVSGILQGQQCSLCRGGLTPVCMLVCMLIMGYTSRVQEPLAMP